MWCDAARAQRLEVCLKRAKFPDALRDVAKQVQRNKTAFGKRPEEMPVFGTQAARFNDDGVTALYQALKVRLGELGLPLKEGRLPPVNVRHSTNQTPIVPPARARYLAEIADTVRGYKQRVRAQARLVREVHCRADKTLDFGTLDEALRYVEANLWVEDVIDAEPAAVLEHAA